MFDGRLFGALTRSFRGVSFVGVLGVVDFAMMIVSSMKRAIFLLFALALAPLSAHAFLTLAVDNAANGAPSAVAIDSTGITAAYGVVFFAFAAIAAIAWGLSMVIASLRAGAPVDGDEGVPLDPENDWALADDLSDEELGNMSMARAKDHYDRWVADNPDKGEWAYPGYAIADDPFIAERDQRDRDQGRYSSSLVPD